MRSRAQDARTVSVLVWNYHDDDVPAPDAHVELTLEGVPDGRPLVTHYRVDAAHSNAYEKWKNAGSPQPPAPAEYKVLERAGRLEVLGAPSRSRIVGGRLSLAFSLPRQGVSLLTLTY